MRIHFRSVVLRVHAFQFVFPVYVAANKTAEADKHESRRTLCRHQQAPRASFAIYLPVIPEKNRPGGDGAPNTYPDTVSFTLIWYDTRIPMTVRSMPSLMLPNQKEGKGLPEQSQCGKHHSSARATVLKMLS